MNNKFPFKVLKLKFMNRSFTRISFFFLQNYVSNHFNNHFMLFFSCDLKCVSCLWVSWHPIYTRQIKKKTLTFVHKSFIVYKNKISKLKSNWKIHFRKKVKFPIVSSLYDLFIQSPAAPSSVLVFACDRFAIVGALSKLFCDKTYLEFFIALHRQRATQT